MNTQQISIVKGKSKKLEMTTFGCPDEINFTLNEISFITSFSKYVQVQLFPNVPTIMCVERQSTK
jgi:hypothetical protein